MAWYQVGMGKKIRTSFHRKNVPTELLLSRLALACVCCLTFPGYWGAGFKELSFGGMFCLEGLWGGPCEVLKKGGGLLTLPVL